MLPTIIISNDLEIRDLDPETVQYLQELLTISNPEWEEAQRFGRQTRHLPRYIKQYSLDEDGVIRVPRGLLQHLLLDLGLEFRVIDARAAPRIDEPWPESSLTLRPIQEEAVQSILDHEQGFLVSPAGSGKTVMGLEIARRLQLKTLWLTHRKELKNQTLERVEQLFNLPLEKVGMLHGKKWTIGPQITVGMIPTLRKRSLEELRGKFGVVLVDEAHHVPSATFLHVLGKLDPRYLYGLTATAYRRDKLDQVMFNAVGPVLYRIRSKELFAKETLIKPTIIVRPTGWSPPNSATMDYHDFMDAMVDAYSRNNIIVSDVCAEVQKGHQCIVLVERTRHAKVLRDMLADRKVSAEFVVGAMEIENPGKKRKKIRKKAIPKEERERLIDSFKSGEYSVLIATYDLLAEGFDHRPLSRLFLATPIKWKGTVVQAIGRVQRTSPDKREAVVYDYVDDLILMFSRQADVRLNTVYRAMGLEVIQHVS